MCRLFGFRSVISSQVHQSLVSADNALQQQSESHPDGWGVAYYHYDIPHLIKSEQTAINDTLFNKISGLVSSQTVLAHIRNATLGEISLVNTHPFQFGQWVFAHNGNIKGFDNKRQAILERVEKDLQRFILGNTDSELLFYFFLTHIKEQNLINTDKVNSHQLERVLSNALKELIGIIGPLCSKDQAENTETFVSFLITNGTNMVAFHGGKLMYYSTYKSKCSDRDTCASFSDVCEAPTTSGKVNHLIFSSEPLSGDNIWIPMNFSQMISIDGDMNLKITDLAF
jgi:glutamine amidotransferase